MNDRNPLEITKRKSLKIGRRLGSIKSKIEYKSVSFSLKKIHYETILDFVNKNGNLSMTKTINDCLDKNLEKTLEKLIKGEK